MSLTATPGRYRRRPGDQRLLEILLVGGTPEEAAERAGVSRSTAYRRLAHPGFLGELRAQQDQILSQLRRHTVASTARALEALRDMLNDETEPAAARVSAARVILERADPTPARVEAAIAVAASPDDQSPKQVLADAIERDRTRLGAQHAYSGNGHGSSDA